MCNNCYNDLTLFVFVFLFIESELVRMEEDAKMQAWEDYQLEMELSRRREEMESRRRIEQGE